MTPPLLPRLDPPGAPPAFTQPARAALFVFNSDSQRVASTSSGSRSNSAPSSHLLLRKTPFLPRFTDKETELQEVERLDPALRRGQGRDSGHKQISLLFGPAPGKGLSFISEAQPALTPKGNVWRAPREALASPLS